MYLLNLFLTISMYLNLLSEVTIGNIKTRAITQGEIVSSFKELTDTCSLTLPRNLVLKDKRLDQVVRVGDAVTVRLAVNDVWNTEFTGYVREVDASIPVRIFCEDEMWKLKRVPVKPKSWAQAEVGEVLAHCIPSDYTIEIFGGRSSSVTIGRYQVNNMSAAQVLANLREYGIFSYFRNGVLYVGFAYDYEFDTHVLHFQRNMRSNDLKFRLAGDYKIQVKAIANLPTGQKTIVMYPDATDGFTPYGSELRTLNFGELSPDLLTRQKLLREYAQAEIKKFNVDGYRGTVTTYGIPFVKHGDRVTLRDARYPERESTNLVDRVVTTWGEVYMKRVCEVGPRISSLNNA
jgi:hypothetical protein